MVIDEMELVGRFGEVDPLPPESLERAEARLRASIAATAEPQFATFNREPDPRLRRGRKVMVAAAAVVVAAGVGVLVTRGSGSAPVAKPQGHGAVSRPPTVAHLVADVTAALDGVSGDISYSQQVEASGWTIDSWLSPDGDTTRTTTYDNGVENSDLTFTVSSATQSATVVDYTDHAWWSYTQPKPVQPGPSCKLPYCGDVANGGVAPGPTNGDAPVSSAGVKWLLSGPSPFGGNFTMVNGTQIVNGADTYEITRSIGNDGTRSIWIDQSTNLPVQEQTSGDASPNNNETTTYSWLSPTTPNISSLQVQVPSGFVYSSKPITPPVSPSGGVG